MKEAEGQSVDTESDVKYLDPARLKVTRLEGGSYRATVDGDRSVLHARFVRAFPVSDQGSYVELRDGADKSAGMLRDLNGLDPETLECVRVLLEQRYFNPVILRITRLRDAFEIQTWRVETDRGAMEFSVKEPNQNIQSLPPRRLLVKDTDSNTYEIPDWDGLDPESYKLIRYLL